MRDKVIRVNECVNFNENSPKPQKTGLWARTEVVVGYGELHNVHNKNAKAYMDETVYTGHNTVVIGGVQYMMERLFNITGPAKITSLYKDEGIGIDDSDTININRNDSGIQFFTPEYNRVGADQSWYKADAPIYRPGHFIQLFGVGITGTGESDTTVYPVDYREKSITMQKNSTQVDKVVGQMYPFRYTTENLQNTEVVKYFGKRQLTVNDGSVAENSPVGTAYYLKKFETIPEIKHVFASEDPDVETELSVDEVFSGTTASAAVDTFVEMTLKISKKDLKEYFIAMDQANKARLNTIALYAGKYVPGTADGDYGDYEDVKMVSKIIIPPEYLNLSKDINIIYRVYGS